VKGMRRRWVEEPVERRSVECRGGTHHPSGSRPNYHAEVRSRRSGFVNSTAVSRDGKITGVGNSMSGTIGVAPSSPGASDAGRCVPPTSEEQSMRYGICPGHGAMRGTGAGSVPCDCLAGRRSVPPRLPQGPRPALRLLSPVCASRKSVASTVARIFNPCVHKTTLSKARTD
jgi:hypothetical protein